MDDLFVGSLMTSPVETVTPDTTARDAAATLREHDIGSVLIVGDDGLEGIFTTTDCVRIVAEAADSGAPVSDYMTATVATTTPNTTIRDAADTLVEHGIHHLPVVDDTEGVVGIVTTTDLTAYVSRAEVPSPDD